MSFLIKKSEKSYILKLNIKPNAKRQQLIDNGDYLSISIRSKPIRNKANKELIQLLNKRFKIQATQIKIISGVRNSNKIIQIDFLHGIEKEQILKNLFK